MAKGEGTPSELPTQERMGIEIAQAATALGLEIPSDEYARIVTEFIGELGQHLMSPRHTPIATHRVRYYLDHNLPLSRQIIMTRNTISLDELGGPDKVNSGMVVWGHGSSSGGVPIPLELALVKRNPGGPRQTGYSPLMQYEIAEISPVTGAISFNPLRREPPHPQSVSPHGKIFIRGTTR